MVLTDGKDARKAVYATVNTAISEEATADNWSLQSARPMGARWLHHAYEEALDLAVYLRAELDRRKP